MSIPTVDQLVTGIEREHRDAKRRGTEALDNAETIIKTAMRSGRTNLTADEDRRVEALRRQAREAGEQTERLAERLGVARSVEAEVREDQRLGAITRDTGARRPAYDEVGRVGMEERTYRPDDQRTGRPSFFRDLAMGQCFRDPAAGDRLDRHVRETEVDGLGGPQQRAIGTGAVSGLVPPAYLTEQFAALARAGRPVANAMQPMPLPDTGMTVNISRITTGTSAASQASQNAAVSETNAADTLLSPPVVTIAGQQTVSRQAVERGELVEEVLTADLANAHNSELDRQVINGSGASGQHLGILGTGSIIGVTYTDATPTAQELWPKMVDAVRQVAAQRFWSRHVGDESVDVGLAALDARHDRPSSVRRWWLRGAVQYPRVERHRWIRDAGPDARLSSGGLRQRPAQLGRRHQRNSGDRDAGLRQLPVGGPVSADLHQGGAARRCQPRGLVRRLLVLGLHGWPSAEVGRGRVGHRADPPGAVRACRRLGRQSRASVLLSPARQRLCDHRANACAWSSATRPRSGRLSRCTAPPRISRDLSCLAGHRGQRTAHPLWSSRVGRSRVARCLPAIAVVSDSLCGNIERYCSPVADAAGCHGCLSVVSR
jgi:HK97 family phage major capsid protein